MADTQVLEKTEAREAPVKSPAEIAVGIVESALGAYVHNLEHLARNIVTMLSIAKLIRNEASAS